MRQFSAPLCKIALALLLINAAACTKMESSNPGAGSPDSQAPQTQGQTIEAENPAVKLSTPDLEKRIRETFLVSIREHCTTDLKKELVRGTAELAYEAYIHCQTSSPSTGRPYIPITIEDFFSLIDLIQSDMKELKGRADATADNRQFVSALEKMFESSDNGKRLINTKLGYAKDQQARKAMLAMLNMKITRHPPTSKARGYDSVEWIEGASRDVLLAPAIAQICTIQSDDPTWSGESVWLTSSEYYTPSYDVAKMAARLVFQSVGADSTFTPPGLSSMWSMTTPADFLSSFFWYQSASLFCPDKNGPVELDKMISSIKSGEFARQWAALPTLSGYSAIFLNDSYATPFAPEPGKVLSGTWIWVQPISPPVDGRNYGVALTVRVPHKTPSLALEYAAQTAKITFEAAVEGMKIRDQLLTDFRVVGSTRKDLEGYTRVTFESLAKEAKYHYAAEFVDDVNLARKAFEKKHEWLDAFVNYDTKKGASDSDFYQCRRAGILPHLIFDSRSRFDSFECARGQTVWRMTKPWESREETKKSN